jgi:magnesium chelatase subunit I
LPDLAGKIQVALFNIMQEGDVQIKGYPVRLNLDLALVFSANPEDYTARGKIVTPLKDRIGSEIRTHYAGTLDEGVAITQQEAWTERNGHPLHVPQYIREIVEQIAFAAREDKRVDKRSGVSQRLPISTMENVISNAERRALRNRESTVVPRVSDIYGAMPAITGKLELEYEGELKGADVVVRDLIRLAVSRTFDSYFKDGSMQQITQWFDLGGQLKFSDTAPSGELMDGLKHIQGLQEKLSAVGVKAKDKAEIVVSAAEFLLEGLYAHKRIGRSEERVFTAPEKQRVAEKAPAREEFPVRNRRPYN